MSRSARRGAFFDLDGTLADSIEMMRQVFARFAEECGVADSDITFESVNGPPLPLVIAALKRRWGLSQGHDALQRRYTALVDDGFRDVPPAEHASETLETAFRNGWSVAVVTSNAVARTRNWLSRTRLLDYVDIVVGGDDVCLGKPEPEPYRIALARTGCARELSFAVEDSLTGARSATAAGIRTYGYAPDGRPAVDWPETVRLIDSLGELIPELERQRARRAVGQR